MGGLPEPGRPHLPDRMQERDVAEATSRSFSTPVCMAPHPPVPGSIRSGRATNVAAFGINHESHSTGGCASGMPRCLIHRTVQRFSRLMAGAPPFTSAPTTPALARGVDCRRVLPVPLSLLLNPPAR